MKSNIIKKIIICSHISLVFGLDSKFWKKVIPLLWTARSLSSNLTCSFIRHIFIPSLVTVGEKLRLLEDMQILKESHFVPFEIHIVHNTQNECISNLLHSFVKVSKSVIASTIYLCVNKLSYRSIWEIS